MLKLLPHLETLSQAHSGASVRELAFSLRGVIATRGAYQPEDLGQPHRSCSSRDQQKSASRAERSPAAPQAGSPQRQLRAVSELLLEAFDPDVPTRAVALRELAQMIQSRRREAVQAQEQILRVSSLAAVRRRFPMSFYFISTSSGGWMHRFQPFVILALLNYGSRNDTIFPAVFDPRWRQTNLKYVL